MSCQCVSFHVSTHRQDAVEASLVERYKPIESYELVFPQVSFEQKRSLLCVLGVGMFLKKQQGGGRQQ